MTTWLEISNLNKHFNGIKALNNFSCSLEKGQIMGIIGPNGAGKTTLFNVLTGFLAVDSGRISYGGVNLQNKPAYKIANLGLARTFQDLRLVRRISVLDNVLLSFRQQFGENLFNAFFRSRICEKQEQANKDTALAILEKTGLKEKVNDSAADLSYGQQKLLSLVCCIVSEADLLLLDEPVAGIAPAMIAKILEIVTELPRSGKSVIIIEHNLEAIMQVCNRLIFMDAGKNICEGKPEQVRNDPRVIEAYLD